MNNNYDFILDANKLDSIIKRIAKEKDKMQNSLNSIYKIVDDIENNLEESTYIKLKTDVEEQKEYLNTSIILLSKLIELLENNKISAEESLNSFNKIINREK